MSLLSLFRGESRAIDASQFNLGGDLWPGRTDSGIRVDKDQAMRLIAVYACVSLIAGQVASLPIDVFRRTEAGRVSVGRPPRWLSRPNPEQTWIQFIEQMMVSLLLSGNAFVAVSKDDFARPAQLAIVSVDEMVVRRDSGRKSFYHLMSGQTLLPYTADRPDGDILHVMGLSTNGLYGLSPVEEAAQAIGFGLATERYGAKFFGAGAQLSTVIEMPANSNPTEDQLKQLGSEFRRKYSGIENAWKPVVLGNGATIKQLSLPNDQAQFLESRQFSKGEIASLYGVPPHMIGDVERSTSWGSGIEEQSIGFVRNTLTPWNTRLEESFGELLPRGQYVKFNTNALLRGDIGSRYQAYQTGVTGGWLSRNEVRELEDMSPRDGLDEFLVPVNQAQPQETA